MKVYVITKGYYSDYHICGVTLDKDEAEKALLMYDNDDENAKIEVFSTDQINELNINLTPYIVRFDKNGNTIQAQEISYDCFTEDTGFDVNKNVYVCILAIDKVSAIKIAAERRAMFLAKKMGID